jgi:carbon monoxide dehydrogenase subunit G
MTAVRASIDIDVPPARVWDVIMDPACFGRWVTIHRKLGPHDRGDLRKGFKVEQTLCLHRANFRVRWSLAECDAPRHAVWEGKGPAGSRARIIDTLSPLDGGERTRFDYLNEYSNPGGVLGRMAGRVLVAGAAEREAIRSLERLKALLETSRGQTP